MKLARGSAALVGGVAVALVFDVTVGVTLPTLAFWLFAAGAILLLGASASHHRSLGPAMLALLFLAGMWRGGEAGDAGRPLSVPPDGAAVTLTGALLEEPAQARSGARLRLTVQPDAAGNDLVAGLIVDVYADRLVDETGSGRGVDGFRYGDIYRVGGAFRAYGLDRTDAAGSLFAGAVTLIGDDAGNIAERLLARARQSFSSAIGRVISGDAAGLGSAMVVGDRLPLSADATARFRASGAAHILAISGLHVALAGGLLMAGAAWAIGRQCRAYLLVPFTGVWGYAALAGFSPSVTRAAMMFSVYLLARWLGRQRSVLPALAVAATVMVLVDPPVLTSISFQLSFVAVLGIAVLAGPLQLRVDRVFDGRRAWHGVARMLVLLAAVSLAATIATAPLIALNFGAVPLWGVLANALIIPAVPFFVVLAFGASALGLAWNPAGQIVGWPAYVLGEYMDGVAGLFASLPPGPVDVESWGVAATLVYCAVLLAILGRRQSVSAAMCFAKRMRRLVEVAASDDAPVRFKPPAWLIMLAAIIAVSVLAGAATTFGRGDLTVTFFETDRGDMILIETPNRTQVLVDGGREVSGAVRALDAALPAGDRSLDMVVLTHPDADHVGGFQAVLERYEVDAVLERDTEHDSLVYSAWRETVTGHPNVIQAVEGMTIGLDDGVWLDVLWAGCGNARCEALNDEAVITRLRYGEVSFFLTADMTVFTERALMARGVDLRSTVLKVAHHGSTTSSSRSFLDAVAPAAAVIQVGAKNTFGHPNAEVMARLTGAIGEERVWVTSRDGTVTIHTDGKRLRVQVES